MISVELLTCGLFFRLTLRAKDFLGRLQNFHQSYSSLVKERDKTESGKEMPQRIRIAILDTGIDFTHPGLLAAKGKRVKKAWCHSWVGDEEDVKDEDPGLHGTNCAYIMNKAAPEADIYIAKVFSTTEFRSYQAENIAKVSYTTFLTRLDQGVQEGEYYRGWKFGKLMVTEVF